MPGIAGSLLQMIEGAGCGANLDVEAIPRPAGASIERWLMVFPSFGFLIATTQPEADVRGVHATRPPGRRLRQLRRHAGAAAQ